MLRAITARPPTLSACICVHLRFQFLIDARTTLAAPDLASQRCSAKARNWNRRCTQMDSAVFQTPLASRCTSTSGLPELSRRQSWRLLALRVINELCGASATPDSARHDQFLRATPLRRRQQPDLERAPGRLRKTQQRLRARQRLPALQPRNCRLAGAHPCREFRLRRPARSRARSNSVPISNSGASASYSVRTAGSVSRRALNSPNGMVTLHPSRAAGRSRFRCAASPGSS